jgi:hypothetical protein
LVDRAGIEEGNFVSNLKKKKKLKLGEEARAFEEKGR